MWLLAAAIIVFLYWFAVRGRLYNWVLLFRALPGILFDVLCHVWLSIAELFPKRKKKEIELDETEKYYHS